MEPEIEKIIERYSIHIGKWQTGEQICMQALGRKKDDRDIRLSMYLYTKLTDNKDHLWAEEASEITHALIDHEYLVPTGKTAGIGFAGSRECRLTEKLRRLAT